MQKILFQIFFLLLYSYCLPAVQLAGSMFDIRHIGYAEGLSSQRIYSITEDAYGVVWIGSKAGVDRYNGRQVKSYSLDQNLYSGDLAGRKLQLLYTPGYGLRAYDQTGRIYHYEAESDSFELDIFLGQALGQEVTLNRLYQDTQGTLWMALNQGLYKQEKDGAVKLVIAGRHTSDVAVAGNYLFAATSTGICLVSLADSRPIRRLMEGENVQTLYYDSLQNELWIGTTGNGVWVMNCTTYALQPLQAQTPGFLNPVRAITSYDEHTLLIGIDGGGVFAADRKQKKPRLLMNTEDDTDTYLRGNGIYAIHTDRQGNIWIGSYTGGVSVAIMLNHSIVTLTHERGNPHSLSDNNINDIEENTHADLWFGTDLGISILHADTRRWSHHLRNTVVVILCPGADDTLWAGTYGDGIYRLDRHGNVVRHLTKQQEELTTNYLFAIKQDADGELWVGGLEGNLVRMDRQGRLLQIYPVNWVQTIEIVDRERIAVGTLNGFYLIEKSSGHIEHYATAGELRESNTSAYILSMLFNEDNTVWLGTEGGGICLYDMKRRTTVRTFTMRDQLPSNDIYTLQRDAKGRLWASTGKGLAVMDSLRIASLNYMPDVDKEYNKSSFARLADGRFVYGSTSGAVAMRPEVFDATDYKAPLRFTGLEVDYIEPGEERRIRPAVYGMLKEGDVLLDYEHNSFIVSFESINYRFQRDITYQYILEGYEKSWSDWSSAGTARYTNVSPGTYVLKVRSLRLSDGRTIAEQSLRLKIAQPWWNSWWAWLSYVCMAAVLFYFVLRYKSNQLQKRYDEDKIRFFINTAHDIRTPVTLIMAPLEDLYKEEGLSAHGRYLLEQARNSIRKLNALIGQLLEFEKADSGKWKQRVAPLSLNEVLAEEAVDFRALCHKKQLRFSLSLPTEDIRVLADRYAIERLVDNLVSNACKYTPPPGDVELRLSGTKRNAIIEVRDTGIGIPREAHKHLFRKIYRADNARLQPAGGTGFGLLQVHRIVKALRGKIAYRSAENQGTLFTVTLKRTDTLPQPMAGWQRPQDTETLHPDTESWTEGQEARPTAQGKETILIVEDHEELRRYLCRIFEPDYHVVDAADGEAALAYLAEEYPDLILSDVMMPGIQGDELCHRVKSAPDTAGIPFVLLTAKANHDAVVEGLRKGADDYIPKPFSSEILRLKVQGLIENRKRLRHSLMQQVLAQVQGMTPHLPQNDVPTAQEEALPAIPTEGDALFVQRATGYVIAHIADPDFGIAQLCQEMAMSRTLFYSRLKSLTGQGPQEFIRIIRLQKAAELLQEGRNVTEVAADTGFVNAKYFSSLFKKQFGVQPSKYRQEQS